MEKMFLSLKELAEAMGVTYLTVRRYVKDGKIPSVNLGRKTLIPMSYLEELKAGKQ